MLWNTRMIIYDKLLKDREIENAKNRRADNCWMNYLTRIPGRIFINKIEIDYFSSWEVTGNLI